MFWWAASEVCLIVPADAAAADLIAHWPLTVNAHDRLGSLPAAVHGGMTSAPVAGRPAADFNGRDGYSEVADDPALALGQADFSIALWVNPRRPLAGIPGDLINKSDALRRRGFNLHLSGSSSEYSSLSDRCHVHFGVDDALNGPERDHGKPWASNSLISNLVAYQRQLYAGIADAAVPRQSARIFRLKEGQTWEDCGQIGGGDPTISTVMSLIVHEGRLYAGTARWDWVIAKGNFPDYPPPRSTRETPSRGWRGRQIGQWCVATAAIYELHDEVTCGVLRRFMRWHLNPWDGADLAAYFERAVIRASADRGLTWRQRGLPWTSCRSLRDTWRLMNRPTLDYQ